MRVLVIGGTVFVGRAAVEEALARGHEVTVLHRGRSNPGLFGDRVEELLGDRSSDVSALRGGEWDAAIDTCAFGAEDMRVVGEAIGDRVGHYTLVSTIGVYRDWPAEPIRDESAELHEPGEGYERGKVAAERTAEMVMRGRVMHARAGVIVGPHEYVGRLPWWLNRMADGGRVLAPGPPSAPLQLIDVRDLATYMLDAAERRIVGGRNLVAPPAAFAWAELLEACREVAGCDAELAWVDGHRVAEALGDTWSLLPLWPIPGREARGLYLVQPGTAIGEGLAIRPLIDTVADTWASLRTEGLESGWRREVRVIGLAREREDALLAALA